MQKPYYSNLYSNQPIYNIENEQRFIGPIIPFLGGALIGYFAGRPQYNYPAYYPIYYPYYSNYYPPYTYYSTSNNTNY